MQENLNPQRYRVPREDRSLLSIPELDLATRLVEENRLLFEKSQLQLHGRSLTSLQADARLEAVRLARSYTSDLLQADIPEPDSRSCIVSGHQPELFHVGVWSKNFSLSGMARRCRSTAINLVIDNDTLNTTTIRIPAGPRERLRIDRVLFDTPRPAVPWEEATILDQDLFRGLGKTISQQLNENWNLAPLIRTAWDVAIRQSSVSSRLCDSLTAMRAHVERSWGLCNLELPMSQLCETEPFLWFVAHLLSRHSELHQVYNKAVSIYRREHRLRNRMQPVPDLEVQDEWFEVPFWIWQRGDTQRGRLFARQVGSICELRNQAEVIARIPLFHEGSLAGAVKHLSDFPARGLRLRTRALTTTLFARLFLADLFVHGIGGAKYDAMTDWICERLFGLKAPSFLTVSATLYLPLGDPFDVTVQELREITHRLRDLTYNPERHLKHVPETEALIAEKNDLLASAKALRQSKEIRGRLTPDQHRRLTDIRVSLQKQANAIRLDYESTCAKIRAQLSANSFVRDREYAFVLYPENLVRKFLTRLSNVL
jgi:hypothetical protein